MISNFLIDFYSEKVGEQLSQDKFNNIINTYGDDYDSLINDLYSKYDAGNINDDKLNIIKDTYDLNKQNNVDKVEQTEVLKQEDKQPKVDIEPLKEKKAKQFDKGIFKMAEREAFDKYKETGEIDINLLPKEKEDKPGFIQDKLARLARGTASTAKGFENFKTSLVLTGADIALDIFNPEITNEQKTQSLKVLKGVKDASSGIKGYDKVIEKLGNYIREYDSESITDDIANGNYAQAADRAIGGVFESAPSLALAYLGPGGLIALGTSAAGNKFDEEFEENPEEGTKRLLLNSVLSGGAEASFELVTRGILGRATGLIKSGSKKAADELIDSYAKNIIKKLATDPAKEGLSEFATELSVDLIDIATLKGDEWTGLNDFVSKNFKKWTDAGIIGTVTGGGIVTTGALTSNSKAVRDAAEYTLTPESDKKIISDAAIEINSLNEQIKEVNNQEDVDIIEAQIANEENKIINTKKKVSEELNMMNPDELKAYADNIDQINKEKKRAQSNSIFVRKANVQNLANLELENQALIRESVDRRLNENIKTVGVDDLGRTVNDYDAKEDYQKAYDNTEFGKKNSMNVTSSDGFIDTEGDIYINKEVAQKVRNVNVAAHELLHGILNNNIKEPGQLKRLVTEFKAILPRETADLIQKRIDDNYRFTTDEQGNRVERPESEYMEEYFTAFADLIGNRKVKFNENIFTKIGEKITPIFKGKGYGHIKFETGKNVYDFIKSYQKQIAKGELAPETIEAAKKITEQDVKMSKTASDNVQKIYEEQGVAGALDIIEEFKPIVNKIVQRRSEAPNFDRQLLTDEIETGRRGLLELIQDYNIESGVPLAAYINKFLPARAIEASRRVLGETFEEDISQRVDIAAPEVEVEIKTKEEKVPRSLRKKLNIEKGSDLYNKVKDAVVKTFGTKLPEVTDPKFKKALSDSYKRELKKEINGLMGTRSDFKMFLTNNAETLYKSIPQETINKRFQAFSEPVLDKDGKPVREKTAVGKGVFKKKPFNKEEFINYFLGENVGASTKGTRKTALSETIADEMALDATMEVIEDPKVFEKFKEIQEIEGKKVPKDIKPKISEKVKRPEGFKFSKSKVDKVSEVVNEFIEDQTLLKNPNEFAANDKRWAFKVSKELGQKPISSKIKEDVKLYQDWTSNVLTNYFPKSFFNIGNFANAGKSAAGRNFFYTSTDEVEQSIKNKKFGKDNKYIDAAINRVNYVTGIGANRKLSKNFLKDFNSKKFKQEQDDKIIGLKEIFSRFEKMIKDNPDNARFIAALLSSTSNSQNHFIRTSAPIKFYSKDLTSGVVEEHTLPASIVAKYLFGSIVKGTLNEDFKNIKNNYFQGALAKVDDLKLKGKSIDKKPFSYVSKTPEGWKLTDNIWARYFNRNVATNDGGINPSSIVLSDGKTVLEKFKVDSSGGRTNIEIENSKEKAKIVNIKELSNNVVSFSKTTNNEGVIGYAKTVDEALSIARDPNTPIKKIRVFDFDDTLATTKSDVLFTAPDGTEGKLNAEEFAKQGAQLLEEEYVFDFSEFNKVTKGKPGPLLEVAKKIQAARGTEDVFVLTARAPEAQVAIKEFLDGVGLNIPLENITGLGNSTGEAKANWMIDKAAEGYNDFYFADDAYQNVKAVRDAMSVLDVKSKVQQAKINFSKSVNEDFNKIIEQTTGIASEKVYSEAKAKVRGANKGNKKFFIPYSAEDFMGLIYPLLSKGKLGDSQMAWFKKNLLDPYARAQENLSTDRLQLMEDFKTLKKALEVPKDLRKKTDSGFTKEQAVRVYLFNKAGFDVPGISKTDLNELLDLVNSDGVLKAFGDQIFNITKGDGYAKPGESWLVGTITTDLIDVLNTVKRAKYLEQSGYTANVELIFSKENLNKLEAAYGSKYREAMENILNRMKSGKNRIFSGNRLSNRVLDYINNSTGAIMFFNTRSAVLQTISAINFLNWSFNNPIKAGAAFANQPQYWKDFVLLINSDYLVDRRNGLKLNINESEIADAAATSKNKAKAAINYILQKGFLPTQFADSFAIAAGGATFYRNRINDLIKNEEIEEVEAKKQAMLEWRETAEISQQSSDPSKISAQQASDLGRVILAFANTPMQYARIQKRALQDLVKGRGDAKTHVSKIIYYAVVQNLIFNALQSALFGLGFGDDEDDEKKEKMYLRTANGMLDSQLRGLGLAGATVAVIKNFLTDIYERSGRSRPEYVDSIYKLLQISPPISSKISKIRGAAWQFDSKKRRQEIFEKGFSIDNPAYEASAKVISATANIPLDRVYSKVDNISGAMSEDAETWQTIAMLAGWPKWQIMPDSKESSSFNKGSVKISSKKEQGYETLKKLNKSEQEVMLKKLKYSEYEIKRMKKEDQRIKAIMKRNK